MHHQPNILPRDGVVEYYGRIFDQSQADQYFDIFLDTIDWKPDEAMMFGKKIITKRKVAWYGDKPYEYRYSKITKKALPWTPALGKLKSSIELLTGESFNSCLMNLYHSGAEGMAWHSDDEKDLQKEGAIASVSFGAERLFGFKHKLDKSVISLLLEHGSLLIMKGSTQRHWWHRLPPTKKVFSARINLTFRTILE
jgi:alkylated DNA repair dioxygenase AlkB